MPSELSESIVGARPPTTSHPPEASHGWLLLRVARDQRFAFLVAGAVNTAFGFLCFSVYQLTVGTWWGYMWALLLAHITSVLFAFRTHRRYVFKVSGHLLRDLWRFESVYLTALGINAVLLPLAVEWAAMPVLLAQALITIANAVVSWFGHSRFSFRRKEVLDA